MIDRRALLSTFGVGVGLAYASSAFGQQRKVWRVGFLALPARPDSLAASRFGAFSQGMRELGYVEGDNLLIDWRFADGDARQLPRLAAEFVTLRVDIIVGGATPVISAAQKATNTIPIVMAPTNDPVGSGLVKSLGQPGGNITGLSNLSIDLSPKIIQLLGAIAPGATRIALLANPENTANAAIFRNLKSAMEVVGKAGFVVEASTVQGIEAAFATLLRQGAQAVIVAPDTLFVEQRQQIAELALKHR